MKKLLEQAVADLESGRDSVLVTLLTQSGSVPRGAGAKMLVRDDGSILGTVGGGRLEWNAITESKAIMKDGTSAIQSFELSGEDAAMGDMICGGHGEIMLDCLRASDPNNVEVLRAAVAACEGKHRSYMITAFDELGKRQFCLINPDGSVVGNYQEREWILDKLVAQPSQVLMHTEAIDGMRYIVEPLYAPSIAYICGAGHVAREIAKLTNMIGLHTVVIDERPDFANKSRFPDSDVMVVESFERLSELEVNDDSLIIIVTRGHLCDYEVLRWAITTPASYIGMIGSLRKRALLYNRLMEEEGVSQTLLERVQSPIGLDIGAETPEEIAVSVAAQIIQIRNEHE